MDWGNRSCTHLVESSNIELSWPPLISSSLMMLCCLIGLPGNLISASIFYRLTSRSPINVLLFSLSIIDLCLLLFSAPVMILPSLNVYLKIDWIDSTYPYALVICYPISMCIQSISMWTFVLISSERYLAVCKPFQLRKWCTTWRTIWAQTLVVIFSIFSNMIRFFEYELDDTTCEGYRRLLRDNYIYFTLYHLVFHLITHFILPFSLISFLGANILRTMSKTTTTPTGNNAASMNRRLASQRRTTRMIILVTVTFILCNSLPFLMNVWEVMDFSLFTGPYGFVAYPLNDAANALVFVNSSTTFLFYWAYCQKYRLFVRNGIGRLLIFCHCPAKFDSFSTDDIQCFNNGASFATPSTASRILVPGLPYRPTTVTSRFYSNAQRRGGFDASCGYSMKRRNSLCLNLLHAEWSANRHCETAPAPMALDKHDTSFGQAGRAPIREAWSS